MIHRALKTRPRWLQPHNLRALRRPLPWLIALALFLLVGGVGMIARLGLFLASPDTIRYANEIVSRGGADYGFWALGPLIPPINPDALAAAAAEATPQQPAGAAGPQNPVPIAVVGLPTEEPASPTPEPPTAEPSPSPSPSPTPTATIPPPTAALPLPTRTAAPLRAPSSAPTTVVIRATSTPVAVSSTPVTRPDTPPPPAATNTPQPTATTAPTTPPGPTRTTPPVQPPPTTPPSPSPTSTPSPTPAPEEPPLVSFAVAARTVSEDDGRVEVELKLSKRFTKTVTVRFTTEPDTARADEDFRTTNGTISFEPGTLSRTLTVPIIKDERDEQNERFTIRLLDPENATLSEPNVLVVTITDTTAPPKVSFAGSGRSVTEGIGSTAAIIQLSAPSALDVTVPYTVRGTAGAEDHALRAGTVIIPAGANSAFLRFNIVDDRIDEDDEEIRIDLGTPTDAQSGPPSVYVVTIIDNDTAGVQIEPTQFNLAEGGDSATYEVVLESQPTAPVTIAMRSEDGQLIASPALLTFTAQNWNTPQRVSLRAADDDVDEPDTHPAQLKHSVTSADPKYDGIAAASIDVQIADNDTAGVVIQLLVLALREGGPGEPYTIRLNSQPTAPVTVTITPDSEVTVSRTALAFTRENWNAPQVVTVTAINDDVDEDGNGNTTTHPGIVRHAVSSPDPLYNPPTRFAIDAVRADITDNDTAGVRVTPSTLALIETTTAITHTATYSVSLLSQPVASVTINIETDGQVLVGRGTGVPTTTLALTFNATNWQRAQIVTVTADDDPDIETNPHTGRATHRVTSTDSIYSALTVAPVTVSITDNDIAGIITSPAALSLAEGGASATYDVRLRSRPRDSVTVTLAPDAQVRVNPTTLTFTRRNWNTSQTVAISTVDDNVDEDGDGNLSTHTGTVGYSFTSSDANYSGPSATVTNVTISDNDTAGVNVTPTTLALIETTTAITHTRTYSVSLTSQPVAPVTINVATDGQVLVGQGTGVPTTTLALSFNTANWQTPRSVVVTADDDDDVEANPHTSSVTHTVTSADPLYNARTVVPVTVSITDNDIAGIITSPATLSLAEGGASASYTVRLASRPRDSVTVTLAPDAQVRVNPTTLTFTRRNWNTSQTVAISTMDDNVDEDGDGNVSTHTGTVGYSFTSSDANYSGPSATVTSVTIADNDTAGVSITPTTLALIETTTAVTNTATYSVSLLSQPTANVRVTPGSAPAGVVSLSPALTFTPANWDTPQRVTVTAINNFVDAPDATATISNAVTSGDRIYNGLAAAAVGVDVADDDTAALLLNPTSISVNELITAPGRSAIYTVRLGSQPRAPVTLDLGFDTDRLVVSPASLSLSAANWNALQTVTVSAVDDMTIRNPATLTITHTVSSADGQYAAFSGATVTVSIADDDQAGVTFTPGALSLSESATGTYPTSGVVGVALRSQPTAPVTVTLTPDAQLLAAPTVLVFTPTTWNSAQNVTVSAVNDLVDETASHTGSITLNIQSTDLYYSGRVVPPFSATIEDDDTAAVVVSGASGTTTSEAGGSVTFNVRLASMPLAPVSLVAQTDSPEAYVSSPAMPIVFTAANWDIPVTVTVTGRDDPDYDGLVPYRVLFAVTGDAAYAALEAAVMPTLTLANADDEPVVVSIGDPVAALAEGDGGLTALRFPVSLGRPATVPVTVSYETADLTATGGGDYRVTRGALTIPAGSTGDMIDTFLVGDMNYEADEQFAVDLISVTATGEPVALGATRGVGTIRNDDEPRVRFAAADTLAYESAGTATVVVMLDAPFASTVTVQYTTIDSGPLAGTATAGVDYVGDSGTLTFAPGETTRAVTLTLLDNDADAEELYETVRLNLFNAAGALIGTPGVASVTLVDDGGAPLAGRCTTAWLAISPGVAELRLRNFDLRADTDPTAALWFYGPDEPFDPQGRLGGRQGTASGTNAWSDDVIAWPGPGWWRVVTCTDGHAGWLVEAAADGAPLVLSQGPP